MVVIVRKMEKKLNFIKKLLKLESAAAYNKAMEEVPGPLEPEKISKNLKKLQINFLKNALICDNITLKNIPLHLSSGGWENLQRDKKISTT